MLAGNCTSEKRMLLRAEICAGATKSSAAGLPLMTSSSSGVKPPACLNTDQRRWALRQYPWRRWLYCRDAYRLHGLRAELRRTHSRTQHGCTGARADLPPHAGGSALSSSAGRSVTEVRLDDTTTARNADVSGDGELIGELSPGERLRITFRTNASNSYIRLATITSAYCAANFTGAATRATASHRPRTNGVKARTYTQSRRRRRSRSRTRCGLTTLTGETGAGKSILVDALGLALGERADSEAVRPRCETR